MKQIYSLWKQEKSELDWKILIAYCPIYLYLGLYSSLSSPQNHYTALLAILLTVIVSYLSGYYHSKFLVVYFSLSCILVFTNNILTLITVAPISVIIVWLNLDTIVSNQFLGIVMVISLIILSYLPWYFLGRYVRKRCT